MKRSKARRRRVEQERKADRRLRKRTASWKANPLPPIDFDSLIAEYTKRVAQARENVEHHQNTCKEKAHERRGVDGAASSGSDSGVSGESRMVPIKELIERSSLGTPEAKAMREKCAPGAVDAVLKRLAELDDESEESQS